MQYFYKLLLPFFLSCFFCIPTHAEKRSIEGGLAQSTITNCVSIVLGTPYFQVGTATYLTYYWDTDKEDIYEGDYVYLVVTMLNLGGHCSLPASITTIKVPDGFTFITDEQGVLQSDCAVTKGNESSTVSGRNCVQLARNISGFSVESPIEKSNNPFVQPQVMFEQTYIRYGFLLKATAPTSGNFTSDVKVADGNSFPNLVSNLPVVVLPKLLSPKPPEVPNPPINQNPQPPAATPTPTPKPPAVSPPTTATATPTPVVPTVQQPPAVDKPATTQEQLLLRSLAEQLRPLLSVSSLKSLRTKFAKIEPKVRRVSKKFTGVYKTAAMKALRSLGAAKKAAKLTGAKKHIQLAINQLTVA